jgi:hypothetical protein
MPAANWVGTGNKYYFKIGNGKQMGSERMTWRNNEIMFMVQINMRKKLQDLLNYLIWR